VADSCEQGNEPSGSIKDAEFLDQLNYNVLSNFYYLTTLFYVHKLYKIKLHYDYVLKL
jgi:hypothetical protein